MMSFKVRTTSLQRGQAGSRCFDRADSTEELCPLLERIQTPKASRRSPVTSWPFTVFTAQLGCTSRVSTLSTLEKEPPNGKRNQNIPRLHGCRSAARQHATGSRGWQHNSQERSPSSPRQRRRPVPGGPPGTGTAASPAPADHCGHAHKFAMSFSAELPRGHTYKQPACHCLHNHCTLAWQSEIAAMSPPATLGCSLLECSASKLVMPLRMALSQRLGGWPPMPGT